MGLTTGHFDIGDVKVSELYYIKLLEINYQSILNSMQFDINSVLFKHFLNG